MSVAWTRGQPTGWPLPESPRELRLAWRPRGVTAWEGLEGGGALRPDRV